MGPEEGERPTPETGSQSPVDQLRDRVADARLAALRSVLEVGEELVGAEEEAFEAAAARLDAAFGARVESAGDEVRQHLQADLARWQGRMTVEMEAASVRLEARFTERIDAAEKTLADRISARRSSVESAEAQTLANIAEVERQVAQRIEAAAESVSLKSRRHELKLARQETSRRISTALARLEKRAESLGAQLETNAKESRGELERRLAAGEERIGLALERLEQGSAYIDGALVRITESERRLATTRGAASAAETRVAELARRVESAADWEQRMRRASSAEAEAARRIEDAEARLRGTLGDAST